MQTACPLYKIPSRNTFRRRVDDIYDVISCKFKESLSKVQHVPSCYDRCMDGNDASEKLPWDNFASNPWHQTWIKFV